ncbi:DUF402 domain-containing protein [Paenibacillus sp. GCM10012307]|uniref:DUF402 domain-containing protein n=1 Tax=Paenibacillus roseus TaxID=2798579 RepID=A0A934J718_9BACL|nr:DUF402 domain-containing protein [Paenibacillus roseus]MBJ6362808.1 DUF402 domain-containing protein [Paenibacillus roseus]
MEIIYQPCIIKSFKHDGHLHRMWLRNWLIPKSRLTAEHASESIIVLMNSQTPIQEADRKVWVSKVPAVSFFIPGQWFNVVALIEEAGIRYYCNVASPPYLHEGVLTYIDYDLDVIRTWDGSMHVVDRDEYEAHKAMYHYPALVQEKVEEGLTALIQRIQSGGAPFDDDMVYHYYNEWTKREEGV